MIEKTNDLHIRRCYNGITVKCLTENCNVVLSIEGGDHRYFAYQRVASVVKARNHSMPTPRTLKSHQICVCYAICRTRVYLKHF